MGQNENVNLSDSELRSHLRDDLKMAAQSTEMIMASFIGHKDEIFREIESRHHDLRNRLHVLNQRLEQSGMKQGELMSIPGHIEQIVAFLEQLSSGVKRKIQENVLFSEKAASELKRLLEDASQALNDEGDAVLLGNKTLATAVAENSREDIARTDTYGTEHEERLISGICNPASSPVYLQILDSLKNLFWHVQQISERGVISKG